jgi:ABC-type protease/lipase transport system fused ATPase/permease subunit
MRQAPLLRILDEPSASLDARAEEWLFQQYAGLSRLEGGVTVLVHPRAITVGLFADLIKVAGTGRLLPYDKDRRWADRKDEQVIPEARRIASASRKGSPTSA